MKKLFILGCPRSGTTVLQQALNRHSQIVIPPETKFFYYLYGRSQACQSAQLRRINSDLRIDLSAPAHRIRTPREARDLYNRMARLYVERLDRHDVSYFGDKTPEHTGHLHRIGEVFPDARIIFMYRDGRDVALSLSKMPGIHCDVHVGFVIWLYYQRILRRLWRSASPEIYFVRYEDLALNPTEELNGVLRFLGLPYEPQVAEGCGNHEGIPEREYAWKERALEPITAERIGVWRRELSVAQIQKLERLGGSALTDLGYELSGIGRCRLSPWFLTSLGWSLSRCAVRLPVRCLRKELVGFASRWLFRERMNGRELASAETGPGLRQDGNRAFLKSRVS